MACATVRSVVVDWLLIFALKVGFYVCSVFCVHCFVSFPVFNQLVVEERAGCFNLFVFLVSCDCYCYVMTHPHGAVGKSAVCGCEISWQARRKQLLIGRGGGGHT